MEPAIPQEYQQRRDATLFNLIQQQQWEGAWQVVASDPMAPYYNAGENDQVLYPLHELCRMVKFTDEEISDDEDGEYRNRNPEIYKLARFMIQQSQTLQTLIAVEKNNYGTRSLSLHRSILTLWEEDGDTPLHVLCNESADTTMMRLIFECAPQEEMMVEPIERFFRLKQARPVDLVRLGNIDDCLPLHYLVGNASCPYSALKLMVQYCAIPIHGSYIRYPRDPRLAMHCDGDVPLHWASAMGRSHRRLRVLLSGCHDALSCTNYKSSKQPLDEYVDRCFGQHDLDSDNDRLALWNKVQAILKIVTGSQDDNDDDTWSPLHAIASGIHFIPEAIWSLALMFEEDRRNTYNQDGLLPLHAAVSTPPPPYAKHGNMRVGLDKAFHDYNSRIRAILSSFPEAARMPTSRGRLALHLALESGHEHTKSRSALALRFEGPYTLVILALLGEAPQALLAFDPVTNLAPFMLAAVGDNNTLTTVYELLRKDPSILLARRLQWSGA